MASSLNQLENFQDSFGQPWSAMVSPYSAPALTIQGVHWASRFQQDAHNMSPLLLCKVAGVGHTRNAPFLAKRL
jgi:hypothetical protein